MIHCPTRGRVCGCGAVGVSVQRPLGGERAGGKTTLCVSESVGNRDREVYLEEKEYRTGGGGGILCEE